MNLDQLLDEREIYRLAMRYASSLDTGDWPRLRTCFLDDAVADYPAGPQRCLAEIESFCRAVLEPLDASQHLIGNVECTLGSDRAETTSYFQAQHLLRGTPGGDTWTVGGRYEDTVVRTEAGWRIERRRLVVLWTEGNPAVVGRTA